MRVFIAIPIPPDVKAKLAAVQQEFRRLPILATWVRDAGVHLTLKFLGDVDPRRVDSIVACMLDTAREFHPFTLTVSGMGVFPHETRPRVLWAGIQDDSNQLPQLQSALEMRLAHRGFPAEGHAFTPHLTLARVKSISRAGEFIACLSRHREDAFGHTDVDRLELIESQLHPSGARYSTLKAVHLSSMADDPRR